MKAGVTLQVGGCGSAHMLTGWHVQLLTHVLIKGYISRFSHYLICKKARITIIVLLVVVALLFFFP